MPLALAVGSDLWLATLLTRWNPAADDRAASTMPLWAALTVAALIGGGMLGFAAGMNDLLDQRRDQARNPGRPLPAGRMRTHHAALVTFGSLVTALIASATFGDDSLKVALLAAGGVTAWNAFGRHVPAAGLPMMGLAHAGVMFIPWPAQPFTLPACLVFIQAVVTGTLIHQRSGKRPSIDRTTGLTLAVTSLATTIGIALLARHRGAPIWPADESLVAAAWLAIPLGGFAWLVRAASIESKADESLMLLQRAAVATPPAMAAAWSLALGRPVAAAAFAGTAVACWSLAWVAREVHAMLGAPPAWRG
jgi:4-hydroxybenzoate polyprenyltransferase